MTEWSIGEAVGTLAAFSLGRRVPPRGVRADPVQGVLLAWPRFGALTPTRRVGHRTAGQ